MTARNTEDRVRDIVAPLLDDLNVELFDLELNGGRLVVTVDAPNGLDTETLYLATKAISRELDQQDPISGSYTLEVSSPGLERKLRRPHHWLKAIGSEVTVKVGPEFGDTRRITGRLLAADDRAATIERTEGADDGVPAREITVPYDAVLKARTVFEWGPTPKPGGPKPKKKSKPAAEVPATTSPDAATDPHHQSTATNKETSAS